MRRGRHVRVILWNRLAFRPRFTYRKGMWNRRGVFVYWHPRPPEGGRA